MPDERTPTRAARLTPILLFAGYLALFAWAAIDPYDRATWWAENIPIMILVAVIVVLWFRGVRFSPLAYVLMAVLPYVHTVGGHYTFERVPFGWFSRTFGFERNMYDRIGHFSVGFYAFPILELLMARRAMSRTLAIQFAIFTIAFVAMAYELIEWGYAAYGGNAEAGANFLGSQGDIWDAQKDMLMDTLGAVAATGLFVALRRPSRLVALLAVVLLAACSGDTKPGDASSRASIDQAATLDTTRIPAELRSLAPLAAEWGIGDDDERAQKMERSTREERAALRAAVLPHDQRITAWLDSFGTGAEMSEEAAAYMYLRLAIEEMPQGG